jgi:hypothetical protein
VAHRVALLALLGEHTKSLCGSPRRAAGAVGVALLTLLGEHTRSLCGSPRRAAGAAG